MSGDPSIVDIPGAARYEARVDDEIAGFAEYVRTPKMIVFTHTEVDPIYSGKGVGSAIARKALDDARAANAKVLPICPFIAEWISRHPDYEDLVFKNRSQVND
jgi:predicted GNAT family acetyltransferase